MNLANIWQPENVNFTRRVLMQLADDPHREKILALLDNGTANIWLILAYLARVIRLERYLEIGVRRGFSMAIVGARRPEATLVGFDSWQANYGHAPNPGPDFVRAELAKVGHCGMVELISGDSTKTVPAYNWSGIYFPLILIDGDHTAAGAYDDMANAWKYLAPGGYMVVDDLQDEIVRTAWNNFTSGQWIWRQDRVGVIMNGECLAWSGPEQLYSREKR